MPRVISSDLLDSTVESGRIVVEIEVRAVNGGQLLLSTDPLNSGEARMKVVSGSVTTDETRETVGTAMADLLVDEETAAAVLPLVEGAALSPTAPATVQVRFRAPGGTVRSDYGQYSVDNLEVTESKEGVTLSAEVSDNSRTVSRARFWRPVLIGARTPYATAFHTLLDDILPRAEIQVGHTTARTGGLGWLEQDDRLAAVNEMATAIGFRFDWNADGKGNVDIVSDVDISDDPVWTFIDGGNARIISADRMLTDERSYNGVVAMGEASGSDRPPIREEVWDTDPSSPTYFDPNNPAASVYGPVPFFYVSQLITTSRQARDAARARLPKVLGLVEVLKFRCLPHPGIVPGDPIRVERPRIGVSGTFIVSAVDLPWTGKGGAMTVVCRERRVFL